MDKQIHATSVTSKSNDKLILCLKMSIRVALIQEQNLENDVNEDFVDVLPTS